MAPEFSVVVPVRNEKGQLRAALTSIVTGRSWPFWLEIVLVDDASSDGCCDDARTWFSERRDRVRVLRLRLDRWSGIPFARNRGAAAAGAPVLIMTDANVRFPKDWDRHLRELPLDDTVLCATIADLGSRFRGHGCLLEFPSMGVQWLRQPGWFGAHVPIASAAGTVVGNELFGRLGGYDTGLPMYGAAEPEFSVRAWLSGCQLVAQPALVIHHRFRPSEERRRLLDNLRWLQTANYLRFGLLYLGEEDIDALLDYHAAAAPDLYPSVMEALRASDVLERRELLARSRRRTFDWFLSRFPPVLLPRTQ